MGWVLQETVEASGLCFVQDEGACTAAPENRRLSVDDVPRNIARLHPTPAHELLRQRSSKDSPAVQAPLLKHHAAEACLSNNYTPTYKHQRSQKATLKGTFSVHCTAPVLRHVQPFEYMLSLAMQLSLKHT